MGIAHRISKRWAVPTLCGMLLSLAVAVSAVAGPPMRHPNDIAPKDAPVVAPVGQVIDKTVPVYHPKFLAIAPPAGRYEERKWAYYNTYAAYPYFSYGGFFGGYGYYGFGGYGFGGYGFGGGNAIGASIQNNTSGTR